MIREVTYYQAECDVCKALNDYGEYAAWSAADDARSTAIECEWTEITIRVADDAEGPNIYTVKRDGEEPFKERSILLCDQHTGDGVLWCDECEEDLDENKWRFSLAGNYLLQNCPKGHLNQIRLSTATGALV